MPQREDGPNERRLGQHTRGSRRCPHHDRFAPPVFLALLERKSPPRADTLSPGSPLTSVVVSPTKLPPTVSPHSQHRPQEQPARKDMVGGTPAPNVLLTSLQPQPPPQPLSPWPTRPPISDKTLCPALEGRGDVCVPQDRGRGTQAQPVSSAGASFLKKGPFEATAAGPARPPQPRQAGSRAPPHRTRGHLTDCLASPASHPAVYTHLVPRVSPSCCVYTEIPFTLKQRPISPCVSPTAVAGTPVFLLLFVST